MLRVAPDEYLIAGRGVVVVFQTKEERQQAESVKTVRTDSLSPDRRDRNHQLLRSLRVVASELVMSMR